MRGHIDTENKKFLGAGGEAVVVEARHTYNDSTTPVALRYINDRRLTSETDRKTALKVCGPLYIKYCSSLSPECFPNNLGCAS